MIAAGQSIGNYRILSKIGTGGMGAVYLAEHPLIGKRVALKVIHRELAGNREVVSRFFQEARAVNKIGNEHIVEIHDFGVTPENDHFYIMEYLEGKTLASALSREKRLGVMRALHIGSQIAAALAAAHAAGIIHRDLKPDNIMLMPRLGEQDFVKVLDFGLAKVFSAANAVTTAAGVLLGTPQYMSPEACESKRDIDHRTDIYALGVLLFQMMTGSLPFEGDTMGEVLVKQVTMLPPAPRGLNPSIPPSVEQVLLRCLSKPADARFATMAELQDALLDPDAYLRGSPPMAPARSVSQALWIGGGETVVLEPGASLPPALQKTQISLNNPLPLPAPAPTMIAAPTGGQRVTGASAIAQPNEPHMNTMRIATPHGYSSRSRRQIWPLVLTVAALLGVAGGVISVTWFGRSGEAEPASGSAAGSDADREARAAAAANPAEVAPAAEPESAAAGSAAPAGSDDPEVVREAGSGAPPEPQTGSGGSEPVSPPRETAARSGSPAAPGVRTAHLAIESVPGGAMVEGPRGEALGKTPLALDWPASDAPVTFALRLSGYKPRRKRTVINGNTRLVIELERVAATPHRPPRRSPAPREPRPKDSNGLMRPDD